jgi:hypothetical protein
MSLSKAYLASKLAEPLPTTDGGVLRAIGDAITYMTSFVIEVDLNVVCSAKLKSIRICVSNSQHHGP